MNGVYRTALVCLNGHIVNDEMDTRPEHNENFCSKCGTATIYQCQICQTNLRGYFEHPSVVYPSKSEPDAFCFHCGNPYPWTRYKLEAAKELAYEIDALTPDEKKILSESLDELIKDGPKTQVAALRFKKYMQKAGQEIGVAIKQIVIEIGSEAAKKAIFG